MKQRRMMAWTALLVAGFGLAGSAAAQQAPSNEAMRRGMEAQKKFMSQMTPEVLERANALSPEIKQFLVRIAANHSRHSDTLTLVQVMQEILTDYQAVGAAIAMGNGEHAAEAARRVADHRLPRGGMLPYLPLDKITTKDLSILPSMEVAIEGGARQLADAALKGDMAAAAQHYAAMTSGCVACHAHFRGQPGATSRLKNN